VLYIVLGMHKSGTTLISDILHHGGIQMVESYASTSYDEGNQVERLSTLALNKDLLNAHARYSLNLSPRDVPDDLDDLAILRLKEICRTQDGDWGFKDPRTCLTYPLLQPHLPDHKLIIVFRHPAQVVRHYASPRYPYRAFLALKRWVEYNESLLRIIEETGSEVHIIDYGQFMTSDGPLEHLARFVQRELPDRRQKGQFRNRGDKNTWHLLASVLAPRRPGEILERYRINLAAIESDSDQADG
jgi:hypothetical protein